MNAGTTGKLKQEDERMEKNERRWLYLECDSVTFKMFHVTRAADDRVRRESVPDFFSDLTERFHESA